MPLADRVIYQQKLIEQLEKEKENMKHNFKRKEKDLKQKNAMLWLMHGGQCLLIRKYREDVKEYEETKGTSSEEGK